jgi:hypothetical protein
MFHGTNETSFTLRPSPGSVQSGLPQTTSGTRVGFTRFGPLSLLAQALRCGVKVKSRPRHLRHPANSANWLALRELIQLS